jgi:hypothetical protein
MMQDLVQRLSEKTGMTPDESQQAVNVVVSHLKEKLPAPLAGALDSFLADGSAQGSESMIDKAKAMAAGLQDMFGKKAE